MLSVYKLLIYHPSARSITGRLLKSEVENPLMGQRRVQDVELSTRLLSHQGPWKSREVKPTEALLVALTQSSSYIPLSEVLKSNYQLNQPPFGKLRQALELLNIRPPFQIDWVKLFELINEWRRLESVPLELARVHRFNEVLLDPIDQLLVPEIPDVFLLEAQKTRLGDWSVFPSDPQQSEEAPSLFAEHFVWRPQLRQISLYPFKKTFETILTADPLSDRSGGFSLTDGERGHRVVLSTEEIIHRVLESETVEGSEIYQSLHLPFDFEPRELSSFKDLILDIVQRGGERQLDFSLLVEGKKCSLALPSPFDGLMSLGLAGFEGLDRREIASKGANRSADMALLRHSGFLVGYLTELLSYLLFQEGLDGRPLKKHKDYTQKFERDLEDFLKTRMILKNHAPVISQKLKKYLTERVPEVIEQNLDKTFFTVIEVEDAPRQILKIPQVFLHQMAFFELRSYLERAPLKELEKTRSRWWESLWSFRLPKDPNDKPLNPRWNPLLTSALWDWVGELNDRGVEIRFNQQKLQTLGENEVQANLTLRSFSSADWFELKPDVFFNGRAIDLNQVTMVPGERIMEYQGQLYCFDRRTLPKLETLGSFWRKVLQAQEGRTTRLEQNFYTAPKNMTLELLQLSRRGVKIEGDDAWKEIKSYFDRMGRHSHELPPGLNEILLPHQTEAFQWLRDLYFLKMGGLLADEMGLGKTLSSLTLLESLRLEGKLGRNLIVVPTSLMFNWKSEAAKFVPDLPIIDFSKETQSWKEDGVVIVSYGLLSEHAEMLSQFSWNTLIFDEAHFLKNIRTARSQSARKLNAQMRLALTGTPIENNLEELFSVMDLILPGCLGTHRQFTQKITAFAEDLSSESYKTWIQSVKELLEPVILRRTKKDTKLQLPEKKEFLSPLEMDQDQKRIYKNMAISMNEQVKSLIGTNLESGKTPNASLSMLLSLLRLRQICTDPRLVDPSYKGMAPKFKALIDEVEEVCSNGDSSLVFVQFLHSMDRIVAELTKKKIHCLTLSGSTSRKDREKILSHFQLSEGPTVLVMTLKTGGVGLNLTKANHVFHFEPWWNPAAENQATDRVHRMGQDREVLVRRYIMKDTIEERMQTLKEFKTAQFASLFGGEDGGADSFKSFKLDPQLFEQLLS